MSKKLPIVDQYNPHYQYVRDWYHRKRVVRDGHPKLFARVEAVLNDPDSSDGDYHKLALELEGIPQSRDAGGRPLDYEQALGAAKVLKAQRKKWKTIYETCKDLNIEVPDEFDTFRRTIQRKLRGAKSLKNSAVT